MTQQEIMNYLKKKGKGTSKEISKKLGINRGTITRAAKMMIKYGEIRVKEIKIENWKRRVFYPI